jgi:hypothetical protein
MSGSIGAHGELALLWMYRLGGVTIRQFARLANISYDAASRALAKLRQNRLADSIENPAAWQRVGRGRVGKFYFLCGQGVAYGALMNGVESERQARRAYRRCQMPAHNSHAVLRNEFLLSLSEATQGTYRELEVPRGSWWSESCPDFPVLGAAWAPDAGRANAKFRYELVEPDGTFELQLPEDPTDERWEEGWHGASPQAGIGCRYLLEVEPGVRTAEVISKVRRLCGVWLRTLDRDVGPCGGGPGPGIWPVLFLFRSSAGAKRMRDRISRAARSGDPGLAPYAEFVRRVGYHGVYFALFAGWDELREVGPWGWAYWVLDDPTDPDDWDKGGSSFELLEPGFHLPLA